MQILAADNISLSYTDIPLFKDLSFNINEGDKIGLIAKNGAGKSSLLRMFMGIEVPNTGKIWKHPSFHIIFLNQDNFLNTSLSAIENIFSIPHPTVKVLQEYEKALLEGNEIAISQGIEKIHDLGIWEIESLVNEIMTKLKIQDIHIPVAQLSGGQKKRICLAKALIECSLESKKKLLLLDEPTNHLDFDMIEWLENFLIAQKTSFLLVTHDRYFLENTTEIIWELDQKKLYSYGTGGYDHYLETKLAREEAQQSTLAKTKNLYRHELEWMRKQPKARTTKSKSRTEQFYKIQERAQQKLGEAKLTVDFKMNRIGGKILELKRLYKKYESKIILKGFEYTFQKGDRIGIIGNNGVGKSTFLKIIQQLEPPDSGDISIGETIDFGYYNQEGLQYKENIRIIDYLKKFAEQFILVDGSTISASQFLELFLFTPEKQYTFLDKLSGGEKKRLLLLTVLIKNPNFLILDEPTNDFDIPTLQVLEDFLNRYKGCVLIVSHDRFFLNKVVDRLFIFKGEGYIEKFEGNYTAYEIEQENQEQNIIDKKNIKEPKKK